MDLSPKVILIGLGVLLLLLIAPPARSLLAYTLTSIFQPAFVEILKHMALWVVWIVRTIYGAHATLLRNLTKPKTLIYRDLAQELEEERKKKLTPNL